MRPLPGEEVLRRPRASDNDLPPALHQAAPPHMTYFLGDESTVDASVERSQSAFQPTFQSSRDPRSKQHGAADPAEPGPSKPALPHDRDGGGASVLTDITADSHAIDDTPSLTSESSPSSKATPAPPHAMPALSQPMTPVMLGTSGPASAISGVSSRRNSLAASLSEESGSQAVSLSEDADPPQSPGMMGSGSVPQLVMPSIQMPSRRPFTDEGRRIGRLKVLIAGDSGTGKTSLIKAIVQTTLHIVHVDPIAAQPPSIASRSSQRSGGTSRSPRSNSSTSQITEIYASTKPYPEWWSDLGDFQILKRRKSLGDTVLDRNISFIDTPGYGQGSSCMEAITPVIRYVESHFEKVQTNASTDPDLLNMLGGDGGSQVDLVLYLIRNKLKPVDLEYMRQLSPLTNIIPLLAQADRLSQEEILHCKARVKSELQEAGIRPFSFSVPSSVVGAPLESMAPYAISSTPGSDHEIMDASLLMSPDYVQPLVPTDLAALVGQVFCENGASWLRHAAAKKYLQWRTSSNSTRPKALYRPMNTPISPSNCLTAGPLTTPMGPTSSYSLARITDHTRREERLTQIRLANWAADLQKSLANDQAHYEGLARSERALWLTEKLNECVQDGTLVPVGRSNSRSSRGSEKSRKRLPNDRGRGTTRTMHHQDPLGLLQVTANMKARGLVALEVLGGVGLVGGLVIWMSKNLGHHPTLDWMVDEWSRFWYGQR